LVDPANPEQMAEAAIWIFNHPLNAYKIGLAGRDFIKANFSWENTCKEYQALYRLLLEKQEARVGPMRIKRPTLP